MSKPQPSISGVPLSPYTLLAVTALAISNLMVGIMQSNTFLILASAGLSAAFALVYAYKSGMIPRSLQPDQIDEATNGMEQSTRTKFPLWLFIAVIFVMMPAVLLFLQTVDF
jgi:phosphoglycerol transferase MdoB-like AlkP superfamily enzyme